MAKRSQFAALGSSFGAGVSEGIDASLKAKQRKQEEEARRQDLIEAMTKYQELSAEPDIKYTDIDTIRQQTQQGLDLELANVRQQMEQQGADPQMVKDALSQATMQFTGGKDLEQHIQDSFATIQQSEKRFVEQRRLEKERLGTALRAGLFGGVGVDPESGKPTQIASTERIAGMQAKTATQRFEKQQAQQLRLHQQSIRADEQKQLRAIQANKELAKEDRQARIDLLQEQTNQKLEQLAFTATQEKQKIQDLGDSLRVLYPGKGEEEYSNAALLIATGNKELVESGMDKLGAGKHVLMLPEGTNAGNFSVRLKEAVPARPGDPRYENWIPITAFKPVLGTTSGIGKGKQTEKARSEESFVNSIADKLPGFDTANENQKARAASYIPYTGNGLTAESIKQFPDPDPEVDIAAGIEPEQVEYERNKLVRMRDTYAALMDQTIQSPLVYSARAEQVSDYIKNRVRDMFDDRGNEDRKKQVDALVANGLSSASVRAMVPTLIKDFRAAHPERFAQSANEPEPTTEEQSPSIDSFSNLKPATQALINKNLGRLERPSDVAGIMGLVLRNEQSSGRYIEPDLILSIEAHINKSSNPEKAQIDEFLEEQSIIPGEHLRKQRQYAAARRLAVGFANPEIRAQFGLENTPEAAAVFFDTYLSRGVIPGTDADLKALGATQATRKAVFLEAVSRFIK